MTETDPAAVTDSLATWLSTRSDRELAELLRLRPDLAVPPPANLSVLASRAEQRASVLRVADDLSVLELTLIGLLARDGAAESGVRRDQLAEAVAGRAPARADTTTPISCCRNFASPWLLIAIRVRFWR